MQPHISQYSVNLTGRKQALYFMPTSNLQLVKRFRDQPDTIFTQLRHEAAISSTRKAVGRVDRKRVMLSTSSSKWLGCLVQGLNQNPYRRLHPNTNQTSPSDII